MITWAERAKAAVSQTGRSGTAKTDETAAESLLAVSAVPTEAVSAKPEQLSSVLAVPSPALSENPDRWCWPHSSAMNGAEINTFTVRLHNFTDKGLSRDDGETLADKLVLRDRDLDDRRICLECKHLAGHGAGLWRCGNWQSAGIASRARDAQLAADLVLQLQRCDGFNTHPTAT